MFVSSEMINLVFKMLVFIFLLCIFIFMFENLGLGQGVKHKNISINNIWQVL